MGSRDPHHDAMDMSRHNRRSIRLRGHDYTQPGSYFVTICTRDRAHLFGEICGHDMYLNAFGVTARDEWFKSAGLRPYLQMEADEFVVMPNHVHGVIHVLGNDGATPRPAQTERFGGPVPGSIPTIVRAYKAATTGRINELRRTPGATIWQRGYHEQVIGDGESLLRIRQYIVENPARWQTDAENR